MDFLIEEQPTETVTRERELVPPGKHVMRIRSAKEEPNEYKRSDANPNGDCLKLCLSTVEATTSSSGTTSPRISAGSRRISPTPWASSPSMVASR